MKRMTYGPYKRHLEPLPIISHHPAFRATDYGGEIEARSKRLASVYVRIWLTGSPNIPEGITLEVM